MIIRPHQIDLTREELRALVVAVDNMVYPPPGGTRPSIETYKRLTVLHERLWEQLRQP